MDSDLCKVTGCNEERVTLSISFTHLTDVDDLSIYLVNQRSDNLVLHIYMCVLCVQTSLCLSVRDIRNLSLPLQ